MAISFALPTLGHRKFFVEQALAGSGAIAKCYPMLKQNRIS
jgi:hypothetical protein